MLEQVRRASATGSCSSPPASRRSSTWSSRWAPRSCPSSWTTQGITSRVAARRARRASRRRGPAAARPEPHRRLDVAATARAELARVLTPAAPPAVPWIVEDDHSGAISTSPDVSPRAPTSPIAWCTCAASPSRTAPTCGSPRSAVPPSWSTRSSRDGCWGPGWTSRMVQTILHDLLTQARSMDEVSEARRQYFGTPARPGRAARRPGDRRQHARRHQPVAAGPQRARRPAPPGRRGHPRRRRHPVLPRRHQPAAHPGHVGARRPGARRRGGRRPDGRRRGRVEPHDSGPGIRCPRNRVLHQGEHMRAPQRRHITSASYGSAWSRSWRGCCTSPPRHLPQPPCRSGTSTSSSATSPAGSTSRGGPSTGRAECFRHHPCLRRVVQRQHRPGQPLRPDVGKCQYPGRRRLPRVRRRHRRPRRSATSRGRCYGDRHHRAVQPALLETGRVTIADPTPTGAVESISSPAHRTVELKGWASDPNAPRHRSRSRLHRGQRRHRRCGVPRVHDQPCPP